MMILNGKSKRTTEVYIDPLVGGVSGMVSVADAKWDIVNFKHEMQILVRIVWQINN